LEIVTYPSNVCAKSIPVPAHNTFDVKIAEKIIVVKMINISLLPV